VQWLVTCSVLLAGISEERRTKGAPGQGVGMWDGGQGPGAGIGVWLKPGMKAWPASRPLVAPRDMLKMQEPQDLILVNWKLHFNESPGEHIRAGAAGGRTTG
jgi:hypothetical protein